jgi:hypothetical protein
MKGNFLLNIAQQHHSRKNSATQSAIPLHSTISIKECRNLWDSFPAWILATPLYILNTVIVYFGLVNRMKYSGG